MKHVSLGLRFVFWAMAADAFLLAVAYFLMQLGDNLGMRVDTIKTCLAILNVGYFFSLLVSTTGKVLCVSAPSEVGGAGFVYPAIFVGVCAILIGIVNYFSPLPPFVFSCGFIAGGLAFFIFVFFLMRLAKYLDRLDMVTFAESALVAAGCCLALIGLMYLLTFAAGGLFAFINLLLIVALVIGGVVTFGRFLTLLQELIYSASNDAST